MGMGVYLKHMRYHRQTAARTLLTDSLFCTRCHVVWPHDAQSPTLLQASLARSLGLHAMGIADAGDWTAAEIAAYGRAMEEFHRPWGPDFKALLPGKTHERAAAFYYNVWKKKAIPQAKAWYVRQQRVRVLCNVCRLHVQSSNWGWYILKAGTGIDLCCPAALRALQ